MQDIQPIIPSDAQLEDILIEACKVAATTMNDMRFGKNSSVYEITRKFSQDPTKEEDARNILTTADPATEEALREYFRKTLRGYNFVGEETGNETDMTSHVILVDPIDNTKGFTQGKPTYGSIIGIYHNGINIASAESNAATRTIYVGTKTGGFRRIGEKEPVAKNGIRISGLDGLKYVFSADESERLKKEILLSLEKEFPESQYPRASSHILNKCFVYNKDSAVVCNIGWARHDLAATPLFSQLTGSIYTDHNGQPMDYVNFEDEFKKYSYDDHTNPGEEGKTKKDVVIYSVPTVIARDKEMHDKMLRVLAPFKRELDILQNPKYGL